MQYPFNPTVFDRFNRITSEVIRLIVIQWNPKTGLRIGKILNPLIGKSGEIYDIHCDRCARNAIWCKHL